MGRVVRNGKVLLILLVDESWGGRDVGELGRMRFGDLCEVESGGHDGRTILDSEEEVVREEAAKTRGDGEGVAML